MTAAADMRAVRLHGVGDLRVERVAVRALPAADAVRVRVRAAGICGSDLHNYRTGRWLSRLPSIPGHEFAGEVAAVGSAVTAWRCGDRVIGDSRMNCGTCTPCRDGRPNVCERMGYVGEVCDGAFADFIDLPANRLLAVPAGIPDAIAALAEPLGVALRVVRRLDPTPGAPVIVAGAGPVGGLAAILLAHLGFGPLGLIDRNAARSILVAGLTGARSIDATPASIAGFAADATAGAGGVRFAIEATGSATVFNLLANSLDGGGRLAMVGIFDGNAGIDANAIVERELEVRGCSVYCDEQTAILPLLAVLQPQLERILSPPVPLESLPEEYRRLLGGGSPYLKSMVVP